MFSRGYCFINGTPLPMAPIHLLTVLQFTLPLLMGKPRVLLQLLQLNRCCLNWWWYINGSLNGCFHSVNWNIWINRWLVLLFFAIGTKWVQCNMCCFFYSVNWIHPWLRLPLLLPLPMMLQWFIVPQTHLLVFFSNYCDPDLYMLRSAT